MSDTPRTDAEAFHAFVNSGLKSAAVVSIGFARELERENALLKAERDEAVKTERERCLRILRSVNNYSNPMTAGDCADLIEKGKVQP